MHAEAFRLGWRDPSLWAEKAPDGDLRANGSSATKAGSACRVVGGGVLAVMRSARERYLVGLFLSRNSKHWTPLLRALVSIGAHLCVAASLLFAAGVPAFFSDSVLCSPLVVHFMWGRDTPC